MNFKEYDNFINNHKYDMLHFIIYYNLKCTGELNKYNSEQKEKLVNFAHDCYLKDENFIDIGLICDKVMLRAPLILIGEKTKWDLLGECYV